MTYYEDHREEMNEYSRKYHLNKRKKDPKYAQRVRDDMRTRALGYRINLINILGGKCSCDGIDCWHDGPCGISDIRCIQIDHIHGKGSQEYKSIGSTSVYLKYLKDDKRNEKVRNLCANCNWVKRHRNKESIPRKSI